MRRKKELTQEQRDWRNSILRGKIKSVKIDQKPKVVLGNDDKIRQCFYYIDNCVFWLNEFIDGRIDKKRLLETTRAIKVQAENLERLLLSEKDH